jgi:hypothetical protein
MVIAASSDGSGSSGSSGDASSGGCGLGGGVAAFGALMFLRLLRLGWAQSLDLDLRRL